jgi:hypothetical protein
MKIARVHTGQRRRTLTCLMQRIVFEGFASSGSRTAANAATFSGIVTINGAGGVPFTAAVVTDANDQGTLGLVIGRTTLPNAGVNEGSQTIE